MNEDEPQPTRLLTSVQVRRLLQISERTLRRYVKDGLIPAPVLRGRWKQSDIVQLTGTMPNPAKTGQV